MYDEGARSWAKDIEALHRLLEAVSPKLKEAQKRLDKLKSKKFVETALAEVTSLQAEETALNAKIAEETEKFFLNVLGILPESIVALVEPSGAESGVVIASSLRVRTLKSGLLVVSVWGDKVESETGNRLSNTLLMAAEVEGKSLKVLS